MSFCKFLLKWGKMKKILSPAYSLKLKIIILNPGLIIFFKWSYLQRFSDVVERCKFQRSRKKQRWTDVEIFAGYQYILVYGLIYKPTLENVIQKSENKSLKNRAILRLLFSKKINFSSVRSNGSLKRLKITPFRVFSLKTNEKLSATSFSY